MIAVSESALRRSGARVRTALPWAGLVGAGLVVAAGLAIKASGGQLGVPLPPFVMRWEPVVDVPLAALAAFGLGTAVVITPALISKQVRSRIAFAVSVYALAVVLGLVVNAGRSGTGGWWKVFAVGPHGSVEGYFEYLIALPLLDHGVGYYLHHFAALLPYSTTHVKGNPPGPLIALRLLGIGSPQALAALCIGFGALCAPLAYDLGRALGDERRGRIAGVLTAFSPAMLLFGVTSVDYAFAAMATAVACLLVRPGGRWLIAGSIAAALASFFSWLLLALPAWAAAVALRHGRQRAAALCLSCAVAVVAMNASLFVIYGYDPFSALRASSGFYSHGIATIRPYAFWVFGSPAAWAVLLGLPVAWLSLRALAAGDAAAVATWGVIGVACLIGFTKGETEKVWLPFVPLACVAAAGGLGRLQNDRMRLLVGALAIQALAIELLFFTVW